MNEAQNPLAWDITTEADKTQLEADDKLAYEENFSFLQTFTTPHGKKVLKWLITNTLDSPTWWPGRATDFGFFREGQDSLVRQIKSKIEHARTYQEQRRK